MAKRKQKNYELTNGVVYNLYITGDTHIHISKGNEKLGEGVWNISLLPGDAPLKRKDGLQLTNIAGTCDGCCEGCKKACYAIKRTIHHHNTVIPTWGENTILAREDMKTFFAELQLFFNRTEVKTFRIHVGGEFFSFVYMTAWIQFAQRNEDVQFYFYTKRFKWLEDAEDVFGGELPKNVHPLVSIWHKNYDNPRGFAEFIYDDGTEPELKHVHHCPVVDKNGHETGVTCAKCKRCRNAKKGDKIAVYAH